MSHRKRRAADLDMSDFRPPPRTQPTVPAQQTRLQQFTHIDINIEAGLSTRHVYLDTPVPVERAETIPETVMPTIDWNMNQPPPLMPAGDFDDDADDDFVLPLEFLGKEINHTVRRKRTQAVSANKYCSIYH